MSKQIEKLRKEFEEQFCEDAGNIKMLKDLYGYKIWEWINENFVPLDEPVKPEIADELIKEMAEEVADTMLSLSPIIDYINIIESWERYFTNKLKNK